MNKPRKNQLIRIASKLRELAETLEALEPEFDVNDKPVMSEWCKIAKASGNAYAAANVLESITK